MFYVKMQFGNLCLTETIFANSRSGIYGKSVYARNITSLVLKEKIMTLEFGFAMSFLLNYFWYDSP